MPTNMRKKIISYDAKMPIKLSVRELEMIRDNKKLQEDLGRIYDKLQTYLDKY
jgi:hypothetical protein